MGSLEPGMVPLGPKIGSCRPGIDALEPVNCLLSLDVDSDRLQYLIARIENGPPGSERGEMSPFLPPLAAPLNGWVNCVEICCGVRDPLSSHFVHVISGVHAYVFTHFR